MTKVEQKLFDFIVKHIYLFFFFIATGFAITIRICGIDFESGDFQWFLNPWWEEIKIGGINTLSHQVGNYNIPYQIITYLLTLTPMSSLVAYKTLSIVFDFILAIGVALVVKEISKSNLFAMISYGLTIFSITVIFNSAFWAQCDSIYVSFIIFAIYFMLKGKNILAYIMLGLSFTFKLQFVFILPVFLFWYVLNRKVSILHLLIIPIVDIVLCIPALLLGRNFADIFTIYIDQTDYGKAIHFNCPNIYAFMCDSNDASYYYLLKNFSIWLTIAILGIALMILIIKKFDLSNIENFLLTSIWTSFTCIMFLSSMHERYSYLIDILLLIYALTYRKHIWATIICYLVSLRGYCLFLFSYEVLDIKWTSIFYIGAYAYFTYVFFKQVMGIQKNKK